MVEFPEREDRAHQVSQVQVGGVGEEFLETDDLRWRGLRGGAVEEERGDVGEAF